MDEDFERPPGGSSDEPRRAVVTDAKHVEAGEVPETYPLEGDPSTAIALTLDFGMETATAYLAWPTGDSETGLSRLLDTLDIELPNLYGETVFVERQGVHAVVVTPEETPLGSDRRAEILGGVGIITGCIGILATVPSVETIAWPLFVLMTIGIFPYFVYTDARYVKTHSDWDGVPSVWATLSALPFYNLGIVGAYLWRRSRAQFFSEQRSLRGSIAAKVRSLL
ncbi:hypothetical protein Hrd1104_02425 [Halorhabdus sp. CBA1104]|uniref:hypothetical protein n=1 Tax=Halorhabdus sp. CBA1104 TaxID=1380432 RepID=UPI0012B406C0|nr:hypothetical protein [Halorhabdus sp. CBA1104]QGN06257.1 hypothetical protein Hrd1104_02425 [Halorhabdus sp. CBA1104]